jgi:hypothetical protein
VTTADVEKRNAEALERLEEDRAEHAKGDTAAADEVAQNQPGQ